MPGTHVWFVVIFGFFTISEQRNRATNEIEALLNYLSAQKDSQGQEEVARQPYHGLHKHRLGGNENNPKLMNIQTLNLFYKQNQRNRRRAEELENALRLENDRMCEVAGRCGCSGPRCGKTLDEEAADDVEQLLDKIGKELDRDQEDLRVENKEPLTGKISKFNVNDNLDLVVLDLSDYDTFKENKRIDDLNDVEVVDLRGHDIDDLVNYRINNRDDELKHPDLNQKKSFKKYDLNVETRIKKEGSFDRVSPEDLASYYLDGKTQVANALNNYVKGKTGGEFYASLLQPHQKKLIDIIKNKDLPDNKIKTQIVKVLFGTHSNSEILPHHENNLNVYVPKYVYEEILQYNKDKGYRRLQKSLFPKTTQQKSRKLNNKTKIIPKLNNWRRNMRDGIIDGQKYGVPFKLIVDGLGQLK